MPARSITIANQHPRLRFERRALTAAIVLLDHNAATFRGGCPPGELSLVFLTDPALATLHGDFLDDPTVTDVITFEGDPSLEVAGEICVSADAALRQISPAKISRQPAHAYRVKKGVSPGQAANYSQELLLYVVHGWLHLAGYDDLQPVKKRAMRRAEAKAMRLLEAANLALRFQLLK